MYSENFEKIRKGKRKKKFGSSKKHNKKKTLLLEKSTMKTMDLIIRSEMNLMWDQKNSSIKFSPKYEVESLNGKVYLNKTLKLEESFYNSKLFYSDKWNSLSQAEIKKTVLENEHYKNMQKSKKLKILTSLKNEEFIHLNNVFLTLNSIKLCGQEYFYNLSFGLFNLNYIDEAKNGFEKQIDTNYIYAKILPRTRATSVGRIFEVLTTNIFEELVDDFYNSQIRHSSTFNEYVKLLTKKSKYTIEDRFSNHDTLLVTKLFEANPNIQ